MQHSVLDYTFAVGKIRALERFLIKSEVFVQALEAEPSEALRLFSEADLYSDELLRVKDSRQLEDVLSRQQIKLKQLMQQLLLDKPLLALVDSTDSGKLLESLRSYCSPFLKDYLKHAIDMQNIKTFLRLYLLKEPQERLERLVISGGFIPRDDFLALYQKDIAVFLRRLEYIQKHQETIDYAVFLRQPLEKLMQENSFLALEKAINDFLIRILKPAKYLVFGPEPILAYYFAKTNEIDLMRMIILAKLNDSALDLAQARLSEVYA